MLDRRKFIKETTLTTGAIISAPLIHFKNEEDVKAPAANVFAHGIASGDPLATQVIIWTRISVEKEEPVLVKWVIAKDKDCKQVVNSGETTTSADKDYTIKLDVTGLAPATTYYYRFAVGNEVSPVGKTKTTPLNNVDALQFAVVSCSDYAAGFYNAYANIAERKDLDAVIHLGDYIYEGTKRGFDLQHTPEDDGYEAVHFNRNPQWWLHYYRLRYSINRLDPDLQAIHKEHPFITVWDDHEIADNAWKNGANDFNEERDGDWTIRKNIAKKVYAEWMPIRGNCDKIYRTIRYGDLAELIMLDTRLEGRDKQIYNAEDPGIYAEDRTILGKQQYDWFLQRLKSSPCHWKLVGNQVVFSEFNVKWASFGGHFTNEVKQLENTLLDYWEGYAAERDKVINHITKKKINNVVILSASMHCALAFDVTLRATKHSRKGDLPTYDAATGKGSVAVEFAATSVTSANFDERMGSFYASTFQSLCNKKLPPPISYNPNPHLKFADLQRHGYFILKLNKEKAEADFYFVNDLKVKNKKETKAATWHTRSGKNRLEKI